MAKESKIISSKKFYQEGRIIGGKKFYLEGTYRSKDVAGVEAARFRKKGYLVRIKPTGPDKRYALYNVWTHNPQYRRRRVW